MTKIIKKFDQYDKFLILRGLLILMVIIYHSIPPRTIPWPYFANGRVAVFGFFVLSGYLMGKMFYLGKYKPTWEGIKDFYKKRAQRILPLYYFALLIFLLFPYGGLQQKGNWDAFIHIATFTYDGTGRFVFNNAWWAVSTEVQFYVIVPILFLYFRRFFAHKWQIFFAFFAVLALGVILRKIFFTVPQEQLGYFYPILRFPLVQNCDTFLAGFLLYPLMNAFPKVCKRLSDWRILSVLLFAGLYLLAAITWFSEPVHSILQRHVYLVYAGTFSSIVFCLIFAMVDRTQPIGTVADKLGWKLIKQPVRALEFLGLTSYGMFLWHVAILQTEGSLVIYDGQLYKYFLKTFLTIFWTIVLSAATYYYVEKANLTSRA